MTSQQTISRQKIQSEIEDWIYNMNSSGILDGEYYLALHGFEEGFEELTVEELNNLASSNPNFYKIQSKHQPRASITFEFESIKVDPHMSKYTQKVPKVEVFLNPNKVEKETFKKFIEYGWAIQNGPFKYTFIQDDVFDKKSEVAELIFRTVNYSLNHYIWKIKRIYKNQSS